MKIILSASALFASLSTAANSQAGLDYCAFNLMGKGNASYLATQLLISAYKSVGRRQLSWRDLRCPQKCWLADRPYKGQFRLLPLSLPWWWDNLEDWELSLGMRRRWRQQRWLLRVRICGQWTPSKMRCWRNWFVLRTCKYVKMFSIPWFEFLEL